MKCTDIREQMESFLDNETSPAFKDRLEIHLEECQLCSLNLRELRAVKQALRASLPASPSRQFDERMMKAFSERQEETLSFAPSEAINLPSAKISEENQLSPTITKIVEVPVVREKIITRVVYLDRNKQNGIQAKRINPKLPGNIALNNSIAENGYLTQINLEGFQPASEITTTVIKGEGNDKK
jgi:hypothetical protein